jgi:hypothetical protein
MINNFFHILIKPLLVSLTINRKIFETPNRSLNKKSLN